MKILADIDRWSGSVRRLCGCIGIHRSRTARIDGQRQVVLGKSPSAVDRRPSGRPGPLGTRGGGLQSRRGAIAPNHGPEAQEQQPDDGRADGKADDADDDEMVKANRTSVDCCVRRPADRCSDVVQRCRNKYARPPYCRTEIYAARVSRGSSCYRSITNLLSASDSSRKPAGRRRCCRSNGQTDGRMDGHSPVV